MATTGPCRERRPPQQRGRRPSSPGARSFNCGSRSSSSWWADRPLAWVLVTENPMQAKLDDLRQRKDEAYHAGSERAVERQHARGKLLARERVEVLLDPGSFQELDLLARHRAHAAGL